MREIIINPELENLENIDLGRRGEHDVLAIILELKDWITKYGADGVPEIIITRPDQIQYFAVLEKTGETTWKWIVKEADTAEEGRGQLQILYLTTSGEKKSREYATKVRHSIFAPAQLPDPVKPYYEELVKVGAKATVDADRSETAADRAETAAGETGQNLAAVQELRKEVEQDKQGAEASTQAALQSYKDADSAKADAQLAAQTSKEDATKAQRAAESASASEQAAAADAQNTADDRAEVGAFVKQADGIKNQMNDKIIEFNGLAHEVRADAQAAHTAAGNAKQSEENTKKIVEKFVVNAENKETEVMQNITTKQNEVIKAVENEGAKQTQAVETKGTEQVGEVQTAGTKAKGEVTAEGEKQREILTDIAKPLVKNDDLMKLAIKPEVSGNPIIIKDSTDFPIVKLELIGSTTQGENPSPENPQEIVMGEWDRVSDTGKNLVDIPSVKFDNTTTDLLDINVDLTGEMVFSFDTVIKSVETAGAFWEIVIDGKQELLKPSVKTYKIKGHLTEIVLRNWSRCTGELLYAQLELGITPTTYEPYKGLVETLPEKIQLSKWDKIKLINGVWSVERNALRVDLTEQSDVSYSVSDKRFSIKLKNSLYADEQTRHEIPCNRFKFDEHKGIVGVGFQYRNIAFFYPPSEVNSTELAKEWLKNNPTYFYYQLATPTYEVLPQEAQDLLNRICTFYPNTVLQTNEGITLNLRYIADPKLYNDRTNKEILDRISQLEATVIK